MRPLIIESTNREEAIIKTFQDYGILLDAWYYISEFELLYMINNQWYSPFFIRETELKATEKETLIHSGKRWAFRTYPYRLRRKVMNTLKKICWKVAYVNDKTTYYKIKA